jgi:hypothetical protein
MKIDQGISARAFMDLFHETLIYQKICLKNLDYKILVYVEMANIK